MDKKQTFLVADDHSLIRQGVVFLIEDLEIDCDVHQASSLVQVQEKIDTLLIDLLIIDAHFPDGNSLSIIPKLKEVNPELKILVFTGLEEEQYALKFLHAGVNGFVSKLAEEKDVRDAIENVYLTGEYLSEKTKNILLDSIRNPKSKNRVALLSERELQIAKLYAEGLGNLEIANQLDLKQNTVSTVKKRIFEKLQIDNLVQLLEIIKSNPF